MVLVKVSAVAPCRFCGAVTDESVLLDMRLTTLHHEHLSTALTWEQRMEWVRKLREDSEKEQAA